ncbi:hypothetical protein LOD99_10193 [Oopsacas minuta]|uniref:Synapse differentiation-inducing gene protein 1-like n=1 Tax=Oopsacas minuta TaxID=111878 RepID=A0AAV7KI64_9METZ|nr:hypothetical protein LOD99_10193 [Oopsacas minuta]
MTYHPYYPLQELPVYSNEPSPYNTNYLESNPLTTIDIEAQSYPSSSNNLEANNPEQVSIPVQDVSRTQLSACCLLLSICNYICCPFLGIPALIFAILGHEAWKREEIEAAKSHVFHTKIFNIIYLTISTISAIITTIVIILAVAGLFNHK